MLDGAAEQGATVKDAASLARIDKYFARPWGIAGCKLLSSEFSIAMYWQMVGIDRIDR